MKEGTNEKLAVDGNPVRGTGVIKRLRGQCNAIPNRDQLHGFGDQRPGQFLVVDESAAPDGIPIMKIEGIFGVQDGVVPALDHAGATALANQPFGRHGDAQAGVRAACVEGGHPTRAAAAQNENVDFQFFVHQVDVILDPGGEEWQPTALTQSRFHRGIPLPVGEGTRVRVKPLINTLLSSGKFLDTPTPSCRP